MRSLVLLLLVLAALPAAEVVNANVASRELAPLYRESQPFTATITVRNPHQRAIRVSKIDTTCACSKLELGSRFLIPGETTTLEVASENVRRSGPQQVRVSLFLSDPDLEPIEVWCWWNVRPAVTVDRVPDGSQPLERPEDERFRDVYRFVPHERPDEPQRLRRRIRLASPAEETPPGGLRVEGIDYSGNLWIFETRNLENGAILLTAKARDEVGPLPVGQFNEDVVVRTNHPDKAAIKLRFETLIDPKAGSQTRDPMALDGAP